MFRAECLARAAAWLVNFRFAPTKKCVEQSRAR